MRGIERNPEKPKSYEGFNKAYWITKENGAQEQKLT